MSVDSIVAVIFGRIYLKERLTKEQYFTIIMISLGVFILGFFLNKFKERGEIYDI